MRKKSPPPAPCLVLLSPISQRTLGEEGRISPWLDGGWGVCRRWEGWSEVATAMRV